MAATPTTQASPGSPVPSDDVIRAILVERIDKRRQGVGMVVGVVEPSGRRVVAHGRMGRDDPRPVTADTLFEIGSVTKVFTGLLLAGMAERGEVALDDPVARYLPGGLAVTGRGGGVVTLGHLATHSSGLPRLPENFDPADPSNPYADYAVERLYAFLSGFEPTREADAEYEYSNVGFGLLGHALARRAGVDYEQLVRTQITVPLGMDATAIALSPALKTRLAVGHDSALEPVANWDLAALAGAGALRSTARDLMRFLEAATGLTDSPLEPAFAAMLRLRGPAGPPGFETVLAWALGPIGSDEVVWHNGGTGGYRSFVGFLRKAKVAVVVLSNADSENGVDDIGFHLLDPGSLLAPPPS